MIKYRCSVCGKELTYKADECGDCAKKELKKIFADNPDLKQAYKEALEETFSPENRKKMADDICKIANGLDMLMRRKGKVD